MKQNNWKNKFFRLKKYHFRIKKVLLISENQPLLIGVLEGDFGV